jgi:hypothetical protein
MKPILHNNWYIEPKIGHCYLTAVIDRCNHFFHHNRRTTTAKPLPSKFSIIFSDYGWKSQLCSTINSQIRWLLWTLVSQWLLPTPQLNRFVLLMRASYMIWKSRTICSNRLIDQSWEQSWIVIQPKIYGMLWILNCSTRIYKL